MRNTPSRRPHHPLFTLLVLGVLASQAAVATEHTFYVAPDGNDQAAGTSPEQAFATLERARDAVRDLKRRQRLEGPVTVCLRGGTYSVTGPLELSPEDSGTAEAPIVWRAHGKERPVISGGRRITGWSRHDDKIWKTELPDVKAGKWSFRQLYVNGRQRRRARIPNEGFHLVAGFPEGTPKTVNYHTDCKSFQYASGDIDPNWTNLEDVEVIVYHFWTDSHLPIANVDPEKRIVTFAHRAGKVFTDDFSTDGARYIVENVFEGLDAPGEWYLDRKSGTLYCIPMPGEDLANAEVIAPVAPALVRFSGAPTQRRFVEHIQFRDLAFEYTNFQLPKGNSNDRQGSASVPAAISMTGARHCVFECCHVLNLGTFAVELSKGCTHNRFAYNRLAHLGAGGFRIDGGVAGSHPLERTHSNTITDNEIGPYGDEYPSAVGVLLMNTSGNHVVHNEIHHGWYTGISVGWVWGYGRSVSRDNAIEYNHIHDIGQGLLSDMGGIYTLGVSPGTVLRYNHIHHVEANHYGGWGIYNDEGSSHMLIENNVVHDTKFSGYNIHYAKEVTVRNNVFAFGRLQQLSRGRIEPHKSVFFENNIVYWAQGPLLDGNWKDKEYTFHFHPKRKDGEKPQTRTFEMDYNLYFNPTQKLDEVKFNNQTWAEWRQRGNDRHSLYADPQFVDAAKRDFRLKPGSPALGLGFQPIDITAAGPRRPGGEE